MATTTLTRHLRRLEKTHGGTNAAAAHCGIDKGYWSRLREGECTNPSKAVLEKLGLEKYVTLYRYRR